MYIKNGKIAFHDSSKKFFTESNLNDFFGTSVKKIDDYIMVNL
jgi:ABC-type cobalamin/Fe3+-siderophores transport system ATPase subunit